MTGTSKALKRLGVAGLSATMITAGLAATAASAFAVTPTPATSVTLDKHSDTAAVGTCNPFTATVAPASTSTPAVLTVNITQAVPANTAINGFSIGFCNPTTGANAAESNPTGTTTPSGAPGADTNAQVPSAAQCSNKNATGASPTSADTVSCTTTYTDSNGDGKIIFGVTSTAAGTMTVNAFGDTNGNGQRDVTPSEPGDSATKTWVANSTAVPSTNKISCSPTSATNPTNATHTFKCSVTDANGIPLSGQKVNFLVTSGPDAGAGFQVATSSNATSTPAIPSNATCSTTDSGAAGTTAGQSTCSYTNNGQPGHDVINVWVEENGNPAQQTGEPGTQITKDWVQAAAIGSQISVTCSPNQTKATGTAPNQGAICQDPTSDTTVTYTATVVNGVPATGQSGVLVTWAITDDTEPAGPPAPPAETASTEEALSAQSCLTDASGKCSVTLTNSAPNDGESITVTATVGTQGGGSSSASATKNWHNPTFNEARNITVTPGTATQNAGGVQTFTAMVTDRFTNPVKNAFVSWSETGPGAFRNGGSTAFCSTDATGKCSEDVSSLTSETGAETITATLNNNYTQGNPNAATPTAECNSAAGYSFFSAGTAGPAGAPGTYSPAGTSPNANGGNNVATGAPAGTCSATATMNWNANQGSGSVAITSSTNNNPAACSSFTVSGTAPSGATVTLTGFNFRQGTFTIGTATAAANGQWTFTGSGICYNTTVTASTGSGSTATNSNTVTLGFHQVFINVHFTRVGPYRNGLIEYNVSGSSTSIVGGEPIRVQNSTCRSSLCGITHMRSSGFTNLHIYLKPGTYSLTIYGTGGSDPAFGGDGHQYVNGFKVSFTVTIH